MLHKIAWVLLIIGGLNWLLAVFGWDIASWGILGGAIMDIIYVLVGLSAIYEIFGHKSRCRDCAPQGGAQTM